MARVPKFSDQIDMARRQREEIRSQRIRPKAHTVDRTLVAAVAITIGMDIPPLFIGINPDDSAPEWKYLAALQGVLLAGTCTIEWLLNGALIATQDVTTLASDGYLDVSPVVELAHKDVIQLTITAASGDATNLAASVVIVTQAS